MKLSNNQYLEKYISTFSELLSNSFDKYKIEKSKEILKKIKKSKKKIIIIGNGGSAAIASHACVDYLKIAKIKSMNFNDSSLFTCFANDFGHDKWMQEGVKHYGDKGDLLISISSSGMSKNIINACKAARKKNFLAIITLTGFSKKNSVKKLGDINFWVDSKVYNFIENIHQVIILAISDFYSNTKIKK